jgi:hypothetical protein
MQPIANGWWLAISLSGSLAWPIQDRPAPQSGSSPQASTDVTVIGCVVRLDDSARRPGTTSGAGAASSRSPASSGFALKDAAIMSAPEGAKGAVATRSEREFRLLKTDVKLEKFAGKQVELKAQLVADGPSGEKPAAHGAASAGRNGSSDGNSLRVTAVRALGDTCPAQGGR